ncbi:hypothetical protein GYH30_050028 [Glycine max]|uniref:NAB domain-containing protein n=1 Tax=Glycine max TaxID=3847 RepID=A0A0R0FBI3_SOYBN|nr:hypothetical protein GYH30_050028 [Glycine max]
MLQRIASNAYSWWWASHIRTKQSKWMEQNLQDMEEKVHTVLKLLEEEGDSFAKRAEMYYKRRLELINFVEESFRAYHSLADRYDHISTELQNANNTIASVCPDQVPYMDDDDQDSHRAKTPIKMPEGYKPNIPKVLKPPLRDLKSVITATKKLNPKKVASTAGANKVQKSGLSRKEALTEVDKLHIEILELQTAKEFVKSTYDNAITRHWDTEQQIQGLQEKVSNLQDELGEGVVMDDEEARCLMAAAALKSCQETLLQLELKQAISLDETKIETKRVTEAREKLISLMNEFHYDQTNSKDPRAKRGVKEIAGTKDLDDVSYSTLTVKDMAEKIDSLVNKVISLETTVSSQTALVKRLKVETDELHTVVQTLEGDKEGFINDKAKLKEQLREMDDKLCEVQDLNQIVEDQNTNLQTHFSEAHCNLDHFSEKVQKVKPNLVGEISLMERNSSREDESEHDPKGQDALNQDNALLNDEKSNEEHKVNVALKDTVNLNKELKVAEVAKDGKKNQHTLFESSLQLKELKTTNALKDEEIRLLHQKLGVLQKSLKGMEDLGELTLVQLAPLEQHDIEEFLKVEELECTTLAIEEKLWMSIDELLEENLDFWTKFNARPLYKNHAEILNKLTMWLENSSLLKEELQCRFYSLSSDSQNSVPLKSFIFGVKTKKQKQSIFSCMTPGMQRKYRESITKCRL